MDGVLVVNKPAGMTSFDVVSRVRRKLGVRKAGHGGTLDPMATGVLAVCINEATKISQFLAADSKDYVATALLGVETDTLDLQGKILSRSGCDVSADRIREAVLRLKGKHLQAPPAFSAVKHKGKPLYKSARQGIYIEKPARDIEIFHVELREINLPYVNFFISCSKGTYIRSICADLGERLGTKACMAGLERTRSGPFSLERAVGLESLGNGSFEEMVNRNLFSLSDALPGLKKITATEGLERKLKEGRQPQVGELIENMPSICAGDMVKIVSSRDDSLLAVGKFLCSTGELGSLANGTQVIKIARVFGAQSVNAGR